MILGFYTKKPGSSSSVFVNGSEKPNIHSQKSILRLNEGKRQLKNIDILLEACAIVFLWKSPE